MDPVIYQGNVMLTSWLGYCLAFAQTAFGAGWAGPDAWTSWSTKTTVRHADRNWPLNVYFPIWFDGWWAGKRYGHVAIAYWNGSALKIWSSPISNKPYADTWTSIAQVEKNYGMTYVGWSEDVGGTRVIEAIIEPPKGGDMVTNEDQLNRLYDGVLRRPRGAGEGNDVYLGKDSGFVFDDLYKSGERAKRLAQEANERAQLGSQINTLNNQVAQLTTDKKNLNAIADSTANERDELRTQLAQAQTDLNAAKEELKNRPTGGGDLDQATKDTINQTGQDVSWLKGLFTAIIDVIGKWRTK
ncbi:coiled-coil domain-containing protein [Arthrobacter cavernae]|uniref:Uncharacterized protein n=1 Tax=Arthrobacter cavernae TaxID=2817681 RepID=A0A939HFL1_9MICC|nr:hypothetical protein [Arthrobacter cavernae]MBO1267097.1 hypothetical protein [Arthrobacter cavernae]